jgi:thiol-disulfide isomerase/thioredoxin
VSQGIWVLVVVVALAVAFGGWRMVRDGRFSSRRGTAGAGGPMASAAVPGLDGLGAMGDRATLLQFSSAFCAPCRATRRILGEVATSVPGVAHVEVDAEEHLDLVRRVGVLRTPTTLVLDADGREITRATGAPKTAQVLAALDGAMT